MSSELTFIMNEPGKSLRDRFGVLLGEDTRFFDCLVGYFFISGFHKLYPALAKTEKIRILIGIKTDQEGNDLIKLREAAEAKIHAFIQMLGADARLLTEGEEIKSHDLFAKLISKKTITGEDEEEESELEYLTEIRSVRDDSPELFSRIKRLPKKARSTRSLAAEAAASAKEF